MRRFASACVIGLSLSISGCATLPHYEQNPLTTADVVRHIKCEFRSAAWRDHPEHRWLAGWKAALILTLEVFHNGGQESDVSLVVPLNPGTFNLGFSSGLAGQATRTERIYFSEGLDELNTNTTLDCPREAPDQRSERLSGQLGLLDLFNRALEAQKLAEIAPNQLDYNLDFVIKVAGSVSPRFQLIPLGDKTLSGGIRLLGARNDTDTLKITLNAPQPSCRVAQVDGKCPIPVYIVQQPQPRAARRALRAPAAPRGVTPQDQDALDRAQSRNILQGIDDQLRREGIGN